MTELPYILGEKPSVLIHKFVDDYIELFPNISKKDSLDYIKSNQRFHELTALWYAHLREENLDAAYSVYNDDYYFTDLWNCFTIYSRRYLRDMHRPSLPDGKSVLELTKPAKTVVDIGCGMGYTTSALTEMYSDAKVYGINLKGTKQWDFCERMAQEYGFDMVDGIDAVPSNVDVLFASEYFEHILNPIDHTNEIVEKLNPKYFIIGNAFNTHSIGHFNTYYVDTNTLDGVESKAVDQKDISVMFNKNLRNLGYERVKTKLFNNKPNVWRRKID